MKLIFTKMQGLGNDFVVIDCVTQSVGIDADLVRHIANRHYGVGCDQVLLLTKAKKPEADFGYRIFNADGLEVSQCGNGARCMGLFVAHKKLLQKPRVVLETHAGLLAVVQKSQNTFEVEMGVPKFAPADIPYFPEKNLPKDVLLSGVVNVGNPHAVICVDEIVLSDVSFVGGQLAVHPAFPEGVNVGFVKVLSPTEIDLCVYERGVGMTKACGSGACAAVALGCQQGWLDESVTVHQAGGDLSVSCSATTGQLALTGPAVVVFEGVFH